MPKGAVADVGVRDLRTRLISVLNESWKYFLVSVASLGLDLAVYWALIRFLGFDYRVANAASVSSGLALNYWLSVAFVFKERRLSSRSAEFLGFVLIGLAGLAVNEGLIVMFVSAFGLRTLQGKVAAKIAAAGGSFLFNFVVRRILLFSSKK